MAGHNLERYPTQSHLTSNLLHLSLNNSNKSKKLINLHPRSLNQHKDGSKQERHKTEIDPSWLTTPRPIQANQLAIYTDSSKSTSKKPIKEDQTS